MKYVRKIIALILTVIFLVVVIVCIGVVFSVKNINVTYRDYSGKYVSSISLVEEKLDEYKGINIFTVNRTDIENTVKETNLDAYVNLVSIQRVYPSTINIIFKERVETFAVYSQNAYRIYDADGLYVRTASENVNSTDGVPNVTVYGAESEEEINVIAQTCALLQNKFKNLRSVVESISLLNGDTEFPTAEINLRCGLIIEIVKPKNLLLEKISAAYSCFCQLSDGEKLCGRIISHELSGAVIDVRAEYNPY